MGGAASVSRVVPEVDLVRCPGCRGGGRCARCAGTGKVRRGLFSRERLDCRGCAGKGKCPECAGEGGIPWSRSSGLSDSGRSSRAEALLERLRKAHLAASPQDPRLLSYEAFARVPSRRGFAFDGFDHLEKREREILAYREYLLFEEIRRDFYRKFRDELVEAGEHVHLEDVVRDAGAGKLPVEFLAAVESKLQELQGTGELVSVLLFRPEDLTVDGKPLQPVVPEQGAPELVAAIVDKATMKRLIVRSPARGFTGR